MVKALYMSSNTYFVGLEDALGSVEGPVRMAQRMGLHSIDPIADKIIAENRGSFTLGSESTSPLDLASAYATLDAQGRQCDPIPVTQVLDPSGQPLTDRNGQPVVRNDNCKDDAIPAGVATTITQILRKDVEPGNPGQTAERAYVPGHQIAGKTGTSQSNFSAAFVGYTPEYVASVMVLNPKRNQNVGGFGGNKPATIWHDAMQPILANQATAEFPPADPAVANGKTVTVPSCSSVNDCVTVLDAAALRHTINRVDSDQPAGAFLGTNPPAGAPVNPNQAVSIQVSNGSAVQPNPAPAPAPPGVNQPPAPGQRAPGGGRRGGGGGHGGGGDGGGGNG
jgi:membrane peptidoglycan carboxypeptidase